MATPAHFGFAKLVVADLDAASAFYRAVFGLEPLQTVESDIAGRPIKEIIFRPTADGAGTFVLLTFVGTAKPASDESIVGFITADIDGLFERARAAGGTIAQTVRDQPEHGVRVGFLADPEGHLIEVVQMLAKDG